MTVCAKESGSLNPTEYDSRRRVSQSRNSCVHPAPSARIRMCLPRVSGQLLQRVGHHTDVVGGGVRPGVAGPEQHRERLAGAGRAVIGEHPQRVVAEPALVLCT